MDLKTVMDLFYKSDDRKDGCSSWKYNPKCPMVKEKEKAYKIWKKHFEIFLNLFCSGTDNFWGLICAAIRTSILQRFYKITLMTAHLICSLMVNQTQTAVGANVSSFTL